MSAVGPRAVASDRWHRLTREDEEPAAREREVRVLGGGGDQVVRTPRTLTEDVGEGLRASEGAPVGVRLRGTGAPLRAGALAPSPWENHLRSELAACAGMPLDVFFSERGARNGEALKVCWSCPVRRRCLARKLEFMRGVVATAGVFGGTTPGQRRQMLRAGQF